MCTPHRGASPFHELSISPLQVGTGRRPSLPPQPALIPISRDLLELQIPAAGGGDYLWGRTFCLKPEKAVVRPDI